MKSGRLLTSAVSAIAFFTVTTVAAPLAHAGGGMGGALGGIVDLGVDPPSLLCRTIRSAGTGTSHTITALSDLSGARENVRLGAAVLLCDARVFGDASANNGLLADVNPDYLTAVVNGFVNGFVCYTKQGPSPETETFQ